MVYPQIPGDPVPKDPRNQKYLRTIRGTGLHGNIVDVVIDVYAVLRAYPQPPEVQHAIKKLLCSGQRGVKNREQDIREAIDSLQCWLHDNCFELQLPEVAAHGKASQASEHPTIIAIRNGLEFDPT